MKAPEKIYTSKELVRWSFDEPQSKSDIEYIRTDAFIDKALKWYCLDCECNDNCSANHKCAFRDYFEMYLKGNDKALPPKFSNAFNPDDRRLQR